MNRPLKIFSFLAMLALAAPAVAQEAPTAPERGTQPEAQPDEPPAEEASEESSTDSRADDAAEDEPAKADPEVAPTSDEPTEPAEDAAPAEDDTEDEGDAEVGDDDLSQLSLEELLGEPVATGQSGSFGFRLDRYGVAPYLHAYAVMDAYLEIGGAPASFDMHYFNVFVGANIGEAVNAEIQLEHEHGGEELQVRFAQIDIELIDDDTLKVRAGKFLTPFGLFNEYLYPEFISKTAERPFALRQIVPVSWAEVGVQLRGRYSVTDDVLLNYAVYAVNGLEQSDSDPDDGVTDDGGGIRGMRNNHRDKHDSDKALGGRVGAEFFETVQIGVSGYSGAYTEDGRQRLELYGGDASYSAGPLTIQSEYVIGLQQAAAGDIKKHGGYALVAYRVVDEAEPLVQYDLVRGLGAEEDDKDRLTLGLNFYPLPEVVPTMALKTSYAFVTNAGVDVRDNKLFAQLVLGF